MDIVLVDFQGGIDATPEENRKKHEGTEDEISGIFSRMKPMEAAVEAFKELSKNYDVYLCSTAPTAGRTRVYCAPG